MKPTNQTPASFRYIKLAEEVYTRLHLLFNAIHTHTGLAIFICNHTSDDTQIYVFIVCSVRLSKR